MLFHKKYVLMPINSVLRGARIDFIYSEGPSIELQFHPHHSLFTNNDSAEESVCQFINNFTHYVCSLLDEYIHLVVETATQAVIGAYFDFLEDQISTGVIGWRKDVWAPSFSYLAAELVFLTSETYYVPDGGRNPENEDWARKQTDFLRKQYSELESQRDSLLTAIGLQ